MNVCAKCAHRIPGWASNYCPNCGDGTVTGFGFMGDPLLQAPPPIAIKSELHHRLEGFNQLLLDIYDEGLWLGHLLIRQGISQEQIEYWRSDEDWIVTFLNRLEQRLLKSLKGAVPGHNVNTMKLWYGFGKARALPVEVIADELVMTIPQVEADLKILVAYLRTEIGRKSLEMIILSAANQSP